MCGRWHPWILGFKLTSRCAQRDVLESRELLEEGLSGQPLVDPGEQRRRITVAGTIPARGARSAVAGEPRCGPPAPSWEAIPITFDEGIVLP